MNPTKEQIKPIELVADYELTPEELEKVQKFIKNIFKKREETQWVK
jgi:F0F1-type ATP synthase delta subunit